MKDDPAHALALLRDLELINRRTEREFGRRPTAERSFESEGVVSAAARVTDQASSAASAFDPPIAPPTDSPLE